MRILLIGGNGFLGRFLLPALQQRGHTLAIFHRSTTPVQQGVRDILGDRNQLRASVQDFKRFAPDIVVDLVVSSGTQAQELMDTFHGIAQRVVMLSSMDVYRAIAISHGLEDGPLQEVPLTEESELRRTRHPYPPEVLRAMRSIFTWVTDDYDKIPAEEIVMNDSALPGTVLRLPMVYGPGDKLHRFYPIVKRICDRRSHIIFGNALAQWRSPRSFVANVASAIAVATTDPRAAGRIYNICEEPPFSELDWAKKIATEMQWKGEFVILPTDRTPGHLLKPGNAAQHWSASSALIRRELEYRDPVPIEQAIRETIAWERANPPADAMLAQFDYAAEDAALVSQN